MANIDKVEGHWYESPKQNMAVRVLGNRAWVYDGNKVPWTMSKTDGRWPEGNEARSKLATMMVRYVEQMARER